MFVDFWIRLHNEVVFSFLVFSWMRSWLDDVCLVGFWLDDDVCLVGLLVFGWTMELVSVCWFLGCMKLFSHRITNCLSNCCALITALTWFRKKINFLFWNILSWKLSGEAQGYNFGCVEAGRILTALTTRVTPPGCGAPEHQIIRVLKIYCRYWWQ